MIGYIGEDENLSDGTIEVRNADIPLLASILSIMQEVKGLEERREWQSCRLFNITQHISGMPGSGNRTKGLDDCFSVLSEIDTEHEQKCRQYVRQIRKAENILNSIESENMRAFVMMKYIMNAPDTEIRRELNISRRGFERARKAIEDAQNMASVKWQERYIVIQD